MLSKEQVALVSDPKTKIIKYVGHFPSIEDGQKWFDSHVQSGKFKDLELKFKTQLLWYGKPFYLNKLKVVWLLNVVLFLFLVWKLSQV